MWFVWQISVRWPILNFIEIRSLASEMKHAIVHSRVPHSGFTRTLRTYETKCANFSYLIALKHNPNVIFPVRLVFLIHIIGWKLHKWYLLNTAADLISPRRTLNDTNHTITLRSILPQRYRDSIPIRGRTAISTVYVCGCQSQPVGSLYTQYCQTR
jgi:hypothetical protein